MLVSPMMLAGQFIGIVGIRFTGARIFDRAEIELMKALAQQAMLAIQLMRLSRQSRANAVMAERNRLAQDIHDSLAQGLTGIIVQLEAAEDARLHGLATEADQHQERAAQLARESLHEARHSVHALRPRALTEQQLCSALASLIENTTQGTSVAGKFSIQGEPQRLPDAWEQNLLRIVQESLANTLRHAHATEFKVEIIFTVHEIRLHISDNGKGFAPDQIRDGIGLRGLKERTESMGGKLTIQSERGTGTRIEAVIPTVAGT
jgi:signal transduction histidine kinase